MGLCKLSVMEHGGSWKRMYFERRLWRLVEKFVPRLSDPEELVRMVSVGGKFVRRLEISELIPPVVHLVKESDEDAQKGSLNTAIKTKTTKDAACGITFICLSSSSSSSSTFIIS